MVTDFQGIQWMVADSWTALHAASLARDLAAVVYDQGQDTALETTAPSSWPLPARRARPGRPTA